VTAWGDLDVDVEIIVQALPYRYHAAFEWEVRPGLDMERRQEIEGWLRARVQAYLAGRALDDAPWTWDNFAARHQLIGRRVTIGGM